jgi:hypothetical protein
MAGLKMENIHTVEQLKLFIEDELYVKGKGINDVYQEVINYIRDYNLTQQYHTDGVKNGD